MKAKKTNKLKMFNALTSVMESNKKIWMRVKEIEKAYKSFLEGTNKLNFLNDDHEKSLQHLIDKKSETKKNLIVETVPIANVIIAFANENKQNGLIKKCDYTKSELKAAKDLDLVEHSKEIWKEAKRLYNKSIATSDNAKTKEKKNVFNIHNYGLTAQMIDKLEIANVAFIEAHLELKDAIIYKDKCKKKISAGIKTNTKILETKLDLLISIFKSTDSAFYKKYTEARLIEKKDKSNAKKTEGKNKTSSTDEIVKKETAPVTSEKTQSPVPKKRPAPRPAVKTSVSKPPVTKAVAAKPVVTKSENTKSAVVKPAVKTTTATKPVRKRPSRAKSVTGTKPPVAKVTADEPAKI